MTGVCLLYSTNVRRIKMNNRKIELIEHLVRSIDYTKERILHWERLRTRESYDIFVRLNESDKENELVKVEYKDDIVKRIIDDYKRSFKEYDKALDELLEEIMTDEDLMARIKFVVDNLSFRIGDLTLMYEHKQVDPEDFCKEVSCIKSDFVESIMDLVKEHDQLLEEK